MNNGQWLAFNFNEEEPTKIVKYFCEELFPEQVMDPLLLYSEEILKKFVRESDNFTKNDQFRLIFVTKSILVPREMQKTFDVVSVDNTKVNNEEMLA